MKELLGKAWEALTAYPNSLDDYVRAGRWLIYKKLPALLGAVAVLATAVSAWWLIRPEPPTALPVFHYFEEGLKAFSGEAVLLNEDDCVVYRGQVSEGLCQGWGTQLDPTDETTVYEGDFAENVYSGQGRLYKNEELIYRGGFAEGQYSGEGELRVGGKILYDGQFARGQYSGRGVLYQGENILYEGDFKNGFYEGEGTLCGKDGVVVYTGGFIKGRYNGYGILTTSNGIIVYEGGFKEGLYHGAGRLYSEDGIRLVFDGEFVKGIPARRGKIHNPQGQLLYEGSICDGQADYIGLLGLTMEELKKQVCETPIVYYTSDSAGFLYPQLGFAVITQYDYTEAGAPFPKDATRENRSQTDGAGLTAPFEANLVFVTMLVEGVRFYDQIPKEQTAAVQKTELTGFEAFMQSRLAGVQNPARHDEVGAVVAKRGGHLYEVVGLREVAEYDGTGVYKDAVSYYYQNGKAGKGAAPEVIFCERAVYGG